jgi:hypothetical protein
MMKRTLLKEEKLVLSIIILSILFVAVAIFSPWWTIKTSPEAERITNSSMTVDFNLFGTITATIKNSNSSTLTYPIGNITEEGDYAKQLTSTFSNTLTLAVIGLALSVATILLCILATKIKIQLGKFIYLTGIVGALVLFASPMYLMANMDLSKASMISPIQVPSTFISVKPSEIKTFWGSKQIPASIQYPAWAQNQRFWIWGPSTGWYLTYAASFLLGLCSLVMPKTAKKRESLQTPLLPNLLSLIGGVMILLNILIVGINQSPIIIATRFVNSVEEVFSSTAPMWARIAFGTFEHASGPEALLGVILAAAIIYCSLIHLVTNKYQKLYSTLIIILSALSLLYGGGFILGAILAFIGGVSIFERNKSFRETFVGKLLYALKMDSKLFTQTLDRISVKSVAEALLFLNILSGVGNALYTYNVEKVLNAASMKTSYEILFMGKLYSDISLISTPILFVGFGIIKWIILSLIIFLVGVKLFGEEASLQEIAKCTGLAYAPISLQLFIPFIFTSQTYLTTWPMTVFLLTNFWMILILIVGLKHILDISLSKSLATVAFCGAIYILVNYIVFMPLSIPYIIKFQLQPQELTLGLVSLVIAASLLFLGKKAS